jgi:predicted glycoside hydrolase/deacetylase ChbG (UPF0249 family)
MRIIINADDFGLTDELNQCVKVLHDKGIILSTTIIANSQSFDDAVKIKKSSPDLGVGVHLCLDGPFNMSNFQNSTIDASKNQFFEINETIRKLRTFSFSVDDIFKEYELQLKKILDSGIKVSHIDHHHHLHLYLPILFQVIKLAKKYGIPSIRSQRIIAPRKPDFIKRGYRNLHQFITRNNLKTPDGYFELIQDGEDAERRNLERLSDMLNSDYECVEIECHPNKSNDFDTLFLQNPLFLNLIKDHTLINYNNL